jgi:hypothetical protein
MANPFSIRINRRDFDRSLSQYIRHSRRDVPVIVNTKAFYIARRATVETPKSDKSKVMAELRGSRSKNFTTKKGKTKQIQYSLAQLLVVARRASKGLSIKKSDIKDEVKKLISSRLRSIAFLKAGWLPAIKKLEPLSDKIGGGGGARISKRNSGTQYGKPKGDATPAKESSGMKARATILNDALPNNHSGSFLSKIIHHFNPPNRSQALGYVEPALQKAFDFETKSMNQYIEKKLKASAARASIKTRD